MKKVHMMLALACTAAMMTTGLRAYGGMDEKAPEEGKPTMTQSAYVCPSCDVLSLKPGTCPHCEKALEMKHVLGTKDGHAMVCSCAASCKCDAGGMKDGKCGCGKDVGKVSVKGMYVCPEGCPEISDKAGTCACGKAMTMVN